MDNIALSFKGITKSFAGVKALKNIDLEIKQGEVFGIVGENGAGKSTLMNVLDGVFPMDEGKITLFGEEFIPVSPAYALKNGIAFAHQELNLFTNLTVAENMFIEMFPQNKIGKINYRKIRKAAREAIEKYKLPITENTKVSELPTGLQQMVEICKCLMHNPRIIIFDEPTTSLSAAEKSAFFATINDLKENSDITIILISHILEDVLTICDRVGVLRDGAMISAYSTAEVTITQLIKDMVGRELTNIYPSIEKEIQDDIVFEAKNISWENRVKDVSFALKKGEIVGLYGLMGSGRTELMNAVFGVEKANSGTVLIRGSELKNPTPVKCIKHNVAYITEDRKYEGLIVKKPVAENLSLVILPKLARGFMGVIDRNKEKGKIKAAIDDLRIKVNDPYSQSANSLSGGNQQKVVFGKWFIDDPAIILMDEPTKGIDVGSKYEIYCLIQESAKKGTAVLMISSEMEELIGVCDRIMVMKDGRLTGEVQRSDFDQHIIGQLAL